MERNNIIKRLITWISGIIFLALNLYLFLKNPLEKQYNLTLVVLIWSIIILIIWYLFRDYRIYRKMKIIINLIIAIAIYLILST